MNKVCRKQPLRKLREAYHAKAKMEWRHQKRFYIYWCYECEVYHLTRKEQEPREKIKSTSSKYNGKKFKLKRSHPISKPNRKYIFGSKRKARK